MNKEIPTAPEYRAAPRESKNVVNHRKEFEKVDGVMAQVEILTALVNQLTDKVNSLTKPKQQRKTQEPPKAANTEE